MLRWSKSQEAETKRYSVRWIPGRKEQDYDTDHEEVLGSVGPEEERMFRTRKGLLEPGGVCLLWLYMVNKTDNEKGSETVVVMRPG